MVLCTSQVRLSLAGHNQTVSSKWCSKMPTKPPEKMAKSRWFEIVPAQVVSRTTSLNISLQMVGIDFLPAENHEVKARTLSR